MREYASAYSIVIAAQPRLSHAYIEGFSGPGVHISRSTGEPVLGSPLNALTVDPPFEDYHFVDLDGDKVEVLREVVGKDSRVRIHHGDCNQVLLSEVFPRMRYEDYRRALCLLDPYGLQLDWEIMSTAGQLRTIELFINFPILDMNRNALWRRREGVSEKNAARMTRFWGDESWVDAAYREEPTLFGTESVKAGNAAIARAFGARLRTAGGFGYVAEPLPMRNSVGAVVYYLFFASQNRTGAKIVGDIFRKYRNRGV